jgi:hypothetical protein
MLTKFRDWLSNEKGVDLKTRVAVECVGSRWVVLVQNPGQKGWVAIRSSTIFISTRNLLAEEIAREPALETFKQQSEALAWLKDNIPNHTIVTRSHRDIEHFRAQAMAPVTSGK